MPIPTVMIIAKTSHTPKNQAIPFAIVFRLSFLSWIFAHSTSFSFVAGSTTYTSRAFDTEGSGISYCLMT